MINKPIICLILVAKQEVLFLQEGTPVGRDAEDASVPGVTSVPFWFVINPRKANLFFSSFPKEKQT